MKKDEQLKEMARTSTTTQNDVIINIIYGAFLAIARSKADAQSVADCAEYTAHVLLPDAKINFYDAVYLPIKNTNLS